MAKPPFPWIGGKEKIAPYILQTFPAKLAQYVEPFGGSGAVLLALPQDPSRLDIYNDLDAELVNLYSCIKECSNVLLRELKFLPIHSRRLFEYYRDFVAHKEVYYQNVQAEIACLGDRSCFTEEQAGELLPIFQERLALFDVKRAAAYYLAIRGSFSATVTSFGVKGMDVENKEGAGAAGGLGAALCGFLKANLKSGIETVLDLIDFDGLLEGTDLVVTGEGRIDWQSAFGKVPSGIGMRCKAKGVPAVAIVGGMGNGAEKIYDFGVESIIPTINGAMDIEEALERAEELYANAADRTFRMIRVGMQLK